MKVTRDTMAHDKCAGDEAPPHRKILILVPTQTHIIGLWFPKAAVLVETEGQNLKAILYQ
jgi:hypothetical protein